jgi:hypothetical protein
MLARMAARRRGHTESGIRTETHERDVSSQSGRDREGEFCSRQWAHRLIADGSHFDGMRRGLR